MITTTSFKFSRLATAVAVVAVFAVTTVHAQRASTSSRQASSSSSSSIRSASSSSSSSTSSSSSSKQVTAPVTIPDAAIKSADISELPYCGSSKADNLLFWDKSSKQWTCRTLATLFPPKCDGADQALRYDGTNWKCETIGGLLVAHTATFDDLYGKNTCDTKNTWGGATCTVDKSGMGAKLKCPPNTIEVAVNALNGYELMTHDSNGIDKFGAENHLFCYSRAIKVAQ